MLRRLLAHSTGVIPFEVNQTEDCAQNDQNNKRARDWPGVLGQHFDDGVTVDMGSIADNEVPDRSSCAECAKEISVGIVQGACNKQNRSGWKRRRQQRGDSNGGEAVRFEMPIQISRFVLTDSPFERFLFAFLR
jgi:hypothetical protein